MSDVRDPATDQVLPTVNDRPFIQDLLIADIETRKQHGIAKYGTALQSGNGRDMLLDAYEEALDLAIYLRGMLDERDPAPRPEVTRERRPYWLPERLWCGVQVGEWPVRAFTTPSQAADWQTVRWEKVTGQDLVYVRDRRKVFELEVPVDVKFFKTVVQPEERTLREVPR